MTSCKFSSAHWALVAFACNVLASCATSGFGEQTDHASAAQLQDPPPKPGAKNILIAMPALGDFVDARKGLVTEIQRDFNVNTLVVTPTTTVEEFAASIEKTSPVCLVLMNNNTLNLFQKYQTQAGTRRIPPAIVLMTSFLEETRNQIKHITGIAYEVPGVTAFINLRMVVTHPITRIGVVFRPAFGRFIERQRTLAARERIELFAVPVPADVNEDGLRAAVRTLAQGSKVDAIWMLNDIGLIRDAAFLSETWRAALRDAKMPLVVGVPNLIDPAETFGTLAVVPDHEALGLQAANMVFDLADNDWNVQDRAIELPLSVKTVVDVKQVRQHFGLRPDALQYIDRPLE